MARYARTQGMVAGVLLVLLGPAALAADPPRTPPPTGCHMPAYRQFDFWLGDWEVSQGERIAGRNRIEATLEGCAIAEHWRGGANTDGRSFTVYDRKAGMWRQFWVDNRGGVLQLAGGRAEDGSMVLASEPDADGTRQEIRWTALPDGSVRQLWQRVAADGSRTTAFDGLYRPRRD